MKTSFNNLITDKSTKTLYFYIILVIISLMNLQQIYKITKFVYSYNFNFDAGSLMKKICEKGYVEYETERFQVNQDIENIKIKNNQNNEAVLSLLTLITMLFVTFSFVTIYTKNYMLYFIGEDMRNFDMIIDDFMQTDMINKLMYFLQFIIFIHIILLVPTYIIDTYVGLDVPDFYLVDMNKWSYIILLSGLAMIFFKLIDVSYFSFVMVFLLYFGIYNYWINPASKDANNMLSEKDSMFYKYFNDIFMKKSEISYLYMMSYIIFVGYFILLVLNDMREKGQVINTFNIFSEGRIDTDIMENLIIKPFVLLFVVALFINVSHKYNDYVNEFILTRPFDIYKKNINKISKIFDKMIDNNYITVSNDSVCKNVTNAIHMGLYSLIFTETSQPVFNEFLPEVEYEASCENNGKIVYNDIKSYLPSTYFENINMFSNGDKCNSINNQKLQIFISKNTKENKDAYKTLNYAINNILANKVYDGSNDIKISNEYQHNNTIQYIDITKYKEQYIGEENEKLLEEVQHYYNKYIMKINEYTDKMKDKLVSCNSVGKTWLNTPKEGNTPNILDNLHRYTDSYSENIKTIYINKCMEEVNELFMNVNNILTDRVVLKEENPKLTKFVINNFNMFQDSYNKYRNTDFIKINKSHNDSHKYDGIEDLLEIVKDIHYLIETNNDKEFGHHSNDDWNKYNIGIYKQNDGIYHVKQQNQKDAKKCEARKPGLPNYYNKETKECPEEWYFPTVNTKQIQSMVTELKIGFNEYINKDIQDDLLYKNKQELVSDYIKNIENYLNNEYELLTNDIDKAMTDRKTFFTENYNNVYNNIKINYETRIQNINKKTLVEDVNNVSEEDSKKVLKDSQETSMMIYVTLILYGIIYYTLYKIK